MRSAEECLAKATEFSELADRYDGRTRETLLFIARTWRNEAERGETDAALTGETHPLQ